MATLAMFKGILIRMKPVKNTIASAIKYCDCDGRAACPQAAAAR